MKKNFLYCLGLLITLADFEIKVLLENPYVNYKAYYIVEIYNIAFYIGVGFLLFAICNVKESDRLLNLFLWSIILVLFETIFIIVFKKVAVIPLLLVGVVLGRIIKGIKK